MLNALNITWSTKMDVQFLVTAAAKSANVKVKKVNATTFTLLSTNNLQVSNAVMQIAHSLQSHGINSSYYKAQKYINVLIL